MRVRGWIGWGGAGAILSILAALPARADCALGSGYQAIVSGNSVQICFAGACGSTILRQDVDAGTVVSLAPPICATLDGGPGSEADAPSCYVDQCVPAGHYVYGLATPYTCPNGCGGEAPYWTAATVTTPLASGCTWGEENPPPTVTSTPPPWPGNGDEAKECAGGCGCSTASSVLGFDGSLLLVSLVWLWRRRGCRV